MYGLKLAEGGSFQDCFSKLYHLLDEDKLVEQALHKLNNPGKWKNKHKTRDLINAFAEVYNEEFYDEATFEKFYSGKDHHLTDIIFGSSEFTTGIQFRFQKNDPKAVFGNGNLRIQEDVSKKIRLADAAAASSCFPGGFEPIVMPTDFGNGPDSILDLAWKSESKYQDTAIMDGGIIDNQGIEGVMLAESRHDKPGKPFVGTYIISDVSGEKMRPYQVPKFKHSSFKDFFSLNRINLIAGIILVLTIAYLIFVDRSTIGIVISSVIMTIIVLWFLIFRTLKSVVVSNVSSMLASDDLPEILKDLKVLLKTPVYILLYLIKFRVTSVLQMVSDIFLRRIRRLQIDRLYDSDEWNGRLIDNNMYTLGERGKTIPANLIPAYEATNHMPTTLWFTDAQKEKQTLDKLIACGQFSLCFSLMEYCNQIKSKKYKGEKIWDQLSEEDQNRIMEIKKLIVQYWKRFKDEPYWMIEEYKAKV